MSELSQKKQTISSGFTLIELLVVIAIISILSALLMANFIGVRQRGRDAQRKSDLRQIQAALEYYRSDYGGYPVSIYTAGCFGAFTGANGTTYMGKVPCDPIDKTTQYAYSYNSSNNTYSLYACLENVNDIDKDAADGAAGDLCTSSGVVSFTVKTP